MKTICYSGGYIDFIMSSNNSAIVSILWVPVEKRGRGIGRELVRRAQSQASETGTTLMLTPEPMACRKAPKTLDWLIGFYRSCGFRQHPAGFMIWDASDEIC